MLVMWLCRDDLSCRRIVGPELLRAERNAGLYAYAITLTRRGLSRVGSFVQRTEQKPMRIGLNIPPRAANNPRTPVHQSRHPTDTITELPMNMPAQHSLRFSLRATITSALVFSTAAFAQPTIDNHNAPAAPQPQPAQPAQPAPAGPTIVKFDEQGTIARYPQTNEIAALEQLNLTPEEKTRVDAVIAARNEKLDPIVRKNLDIIMRIQGVREEGLSQLITNAIRELSQITTEFRSRENYRKAIADSLSAEKGGQFRAMLSMHRQSWIANRRQIAKANGTQDALAYWANYESFLTAAEDIRGNLDRQISEVPTETLANIRELIAPSQGQLTIIGPAIDDFKKKVEEKTVTPADKVTLVRRIMQAQQDDQRKELLSQLLPPPIEIMAPLDGSTPKTPDSQPK